MITMSLSELEQANGLTPSNQDIHVTGLSIDTRSLLPGNLYVAIIGEQFDGHDFVEEAYNKGAAVALVSRKIDCAIPQVIVDNTIEGLGKITADWRNRFSLPFIAVTGSNGKTTLKNMLAAILCAACNGDEKEVLSTLGTFNNDIGLPLTLARLDKIHRYSVIEMGMNHFGEIAYLTKLTHPDVAVITNAAAAHLEGLQDIAGVARAKGEIFLGLSPRGVAILNQDDSFYDYWCGLIADHKKISFGLNKTADVTATIVSQDAAHQFIKIETPIGNINVNLPLLGTHNVMNALAATAASIAINIDLNIIKSGLENTKPAPGRLTPYLSPTGARIIDDSYNANPFSLEAAINSLSIFHGKKILVLGDMKELGSDAEQLHFAAGQNARTSGVDYLLTYGELSAAATKGFGKNAQHFTDRDKLLESLRPLLNAECTVLIKGSKSMKMSKIAANLIPKESFVSGH